MLQTYFTHLFFYSKFQHSLWQIISVKSSQRILNSIDTLCHSRRHQRMTTQRCNACFSQKHKRKSIEHWVIKYSAYKKALAYGNTMLQCTFFTITLGQICCILYAIQTDTLPCLGCLSSRQVSCAEQGSKDQVTNLVEDTAWSFWVAPSSSSSRSATAFS